MPGLRHGRDVQQFELGMNGLGGAFDIGCSIQLLVGNSGHADIGFQRREWMGSGERAQPRQCIEQSGLAHIGKPENADLCHAGRV